MIGSLDPTRDGTIPIPELESELALFPCGRNRNLMLELELELESKLESIVPELSHLWTLHLTPSLG